MRPYLFLIGLVLILVLPGFGRVPVVDRDEARYAQATVQMIETGDYVDIRFQDAARHKKPVGAYWAQAAAIHLTGRADAVRAGERMIWVHRLPSLLAAILAVLLIYRVGLRLFDPGSAFAGAVLLAVAGLFVFEAHIAKTDMLLCAASAGALSGLARMRSGIHASSRRMGGIWLWINLGIGLLIKGPVLPTVVVLTIVTLVVAERRAAWLRPLLSPLGLLVFAAIALPWYAAIGFRTGGDFYAASLGADFGAKLGSAQETHGGWPGYYLATIWVMFWPGCLLLIPAGVLAWRRRAEAGVRLMTAWIVPYWIVLEIVPTKLPHYPLPLYPAIALLCGLVLVHPGWGLGRARIGAGLFAAIGLAVLGVCGVYLIQAGAFEGWALFGTVAGTGLIARTVVLSWHGLPPLRTLAGTGACILLSLFALTLPRLEAFDVSGRLADIVPRGAQVVSPDYREPSLVWHLGTQTQLFEGEDEAGIRILAEPVGCPELGRVAGTNYARGEAVSLGVYDCSASSAP